MKVHKKVSGEEDYESTGGARNLGGVGIEAVEVDIDEEYEFLRARRDYQMKFIFRKLQQIEKRFDELEGN